MKYQNFLLDWVMHGISVEELFSLLNEGKQSTPINGREYLFKNFPRLEVFQRDGCRCICCGLVGTKAILGGQAIGIYAIKNGKYIPITLDHIIPRSRGGPTSSENLQTMCKICNLIKGDRIMTVEKLRKKITR